MFLVQMEKLMKNNWLMNLTNFIRSKNDTKKEKHYPLNYLFRCDSRHFCNLLFPIIDKDRNGRLNFLEYMSVLSLILPSEIQYKLSLVKKYLIDFSFLE